MCAWSAHAKKVEKDIFASALINCIWHHQGGMIQRKLVYNREKDCSTWLAVMPSMDIHTTLIPTEFQDEAHLCIAPPLLGTPTNYDGCNKLWKVTHTLS